MVEPSNNSLSEKDILNLLNKPEPIKAYSNGHYKFIEYDNDDCFAVNTETKKRIPLESFNLISQEEYTKLSKYFDKSGLLIEDPAALHEFTRFLTLGDRPEIKAGVIIYFSSSGKPIRARKEHATRIDLETTL